jgi:hypothetical protein
MGQGGTFSTNPKTVSDAVGRGTLTPAPHRVIAHQDASVPVKPAVSLNCNRRRTRLGFSEWMDRIEQDTTHGLPTGIGFLGDRTPRLQGDPD